MMSDLDRLKAFMTNAGLEWIESTGTISSTHQIRETGHEGDCATIITLKAGACDKIDGYYDFLSAFEFEAATGKLIKMGIWE